MHSDVFLQMCVAIVSEPAIAEFTSAVALAGDRSFLHNCKLTLSGVASDIKELFHGQ